MSRQKHQAGGRKGLQKFFQKLSCHKANTTTENFPQAPQSEVLNPLVVGRNINSDFCRKFAQPIYLSPRVEDESESIHSQSGLYNAYSVHSSDFEVSGQQTSTGEQEPACNYGGSYPSSPRGLNLDFNTVGKSKSYEESWNETYEGSEKFEFPSTTIDFAPSGEDSSLNISEFEIDWNEATDLEPAPHIFKVVPDEGEYSGKQPLMSTPRLGSACQRSPVTPRTFGQREEVNDIYYDSPIHPVDRERNFFAYPPYTKEEILKKRK